MNTYILQIDTATEICSVSISSDGQLLSEHSTTDTNVHASMLTVFIEQLLAESALTFNDLAAVAVSKGPGSYTGLRIGVSVAKGLCYALDIPLIGVNTLESMYHGYIDGKDLENDTLYMPMLDARRMEVYRSTFDATGKVMEETAAVIIDEDTFDAYLPKKVVVFGSGACKLAEASFKHDNQLLIDKSFKHSSTYMSRIAFKRFQNKQFEDLIYFEPYYLKEFIATISKKLL